VSSILHTLKDNVRCTGRGAARSVEHSNRGPLTAPHWQLEYPDKSLKAHEALVCICYESDTVKSYVQTQRCLKMLLTC
jgi:hypothetical protein